MKITELRLSCVSSVAKSFEQIIAADPQVESGNHLVFFSP